MVSVSSSTSFPPDETSSERQHQSPAARNSCRATRWSPQGQAGPSGRAKKAGAMKNDAKKMGKNGKTMVNDGKTMENDGKTMVNDGKMMENYGK